MPFLWHENEAQSNADTSQHVTIRFDISHFSQSTFVLSQAESASTRRSTVHAKHRTRIGPAAATLEPEHASIKTGAWFVLFSRPALGRVLPRLPCYLDIGKPCCFSGRLCTESTCYSSCTAHFHIQTPHKTTTNTGNLVHCVA